MLTADLRLGLNPRRMSRTRRVLTQEANDGVIACVGPLRRTGYYIMHLSSFWAHYIFSPQPLPKGGPSHSPSTGVYNPKILDCSLS